MNETITLDTKRLNSIVVECTANVTVNGHTVQLSVMGVGEGTTGTERAFENMEEVLPAFLGVKWQEVNVVRVY